MTSTYTSNLNIEKPATGDQVDQWGPTVNDNMDLIDTAVTANLSKAGGTMTGDLILADNVRLEIGSESNGDLALYHDGSNSYIDERGTGELKIKGSNIRLEDNSATLGLFLDGTNDNIALYQSGNVKLQTVSNGINVTGNLAVTGTVDGRDVATDGSTLDATTTTANAALSRAGGTMVGHLLHEDSVSSKFGTQPMLLYLELVVLWLDIYSTKIRLVVSLVQVTIFQLILMVTLQI